MEPSYIDYIIENDDSVIKHYLKAGTRGWRLDVVDELPDEFVKKLRRAVKSVDDSNVIIGEVWEDASNKISYGKMREYFLGDELDSVMNYPLRNMLFNFLLGLSDAESFNDGIMSLFENYPLEAFYSLMNLTGSHDTVRMLTALSGAPAEDSLSKDEKSKYNLSENERALGIARVKLAALFQMTFPGVPCIYYGDEAGLDGYRDPFNRKTYPWGREDSDLICWYRKIISLRHRIDALRTGGFTPVYFRNGVYGFVRDISENRDIFGSKKKSSINVIVINRNEKDREICIDLSKWEIDYLYDTLNEGRQYKIQKGALKLNIGAMEGLVLTCNK
jgi:4-alpha-glucanotransferase